MNNYQVCELNALNEVKPISTKTLKLLTEKTSFFIYVLQNGNVYTDISNRSSIVALYTICNGHFTVNHESQTLVITGL